MLKRHVPIMTIMAMGQRLAPMMLRKVRTNLFIIKRMVIKQHFTNHANEK